MHFVIFFSSLTWSLEIKFFMEQDMLQQPIMVIINQEVSMSGTDAPSLPVATRPGCETNTILLLEVIDLDKLITSNRFLRTSCVYIHYCCIVTAYDISMTFCSRSFWGSHWPEKIISILEHFWSDIQQVDFVNIFEQTGGSDVFHFLPFFTMHRLNVLMMFSPAYLLCIKFIFRKTTAQYWENEEYYVFLLQ